MTATLDNWRFAGSGAVAGQVFDDPRYEDGEYVHTSPIVARNPETNTVRTASGSVYRLLNQADESYAADLIWDDEGWCGGGIRIPLPRLDAVGGE